MPIQFRSLGLGVVALLAIALATAAPVRAGDIFACVEAVAPLDKAKEAAEAAAKAAQCVGQASSGDPVMVSTIAVMTALYAGGAFANTDQCMGVIDSMIGKALATALVQSGLAQAFGGDATKKLEDLANGVASQSFTEIVNSVPALQVLLMYVTCGCQVAGLPGTYEQIANEYKQSVNECAEFASDAVGFVGDVIESGADAFAEGLKTVGHFIEGLVEGGWNLVTSCFGFCDDDEPDCAPNVGVPKSMFGQWSTKKIYQAPKGCGNWFCDEGGVLKTKVVQGKTLYTCSHCYGTWALDGTGKCAPCGGSVKKISADHMCLLTEKSYPTDSGATCIKTPLEPSCCQPGQQMKPKQGWDGGAPDCSNGAIGGECSNVGQALAQCRGACNHAEYYDTAIGQCSRCSFDSIPVYDSDPWTNSIGHCKQCPLGTNGFGLKCETCGPGQVVWSLNPPKKQGLATQKQMAPIAAPPKPAPSDAVARPSRPAPPPDTMTAMPGGPIMGLVEGGRCMSCPQNWFPVYYGDPAKSSLGYCKECPPGYYVPTVSEVLPKDPITGKPFGKLKQPECQPCPAGYDPKHPHVCLPPSVAKPVIPGVVPDGSGHKACPPGTRLTSGACMPPSSTIAPRRRLVCPTGQIPNAAGTSCIGIGRTQPGGRATIKPPRGRIGAPDKRRPSQWLFKQRIRPPTKTIRIPR